MFLNLSVFGEVAVLLALAAVIGSIGLALRQPLIVSFIAVGLLAGPSALDIIQHDEQIDLLAELGIALLLFLVGIKLDVELVRSLGSVSLVTGLGQILFTSLFGYLIGIGFGFDSVTSLYIAIALTFSSTIIIVKLLSDKREIDSLHGQIALGFLIVQDLFVVAAMIVLSTIGIGSSEDGAEATARALIAAVGMVVLVFLSVKYFATPIARRLAHAPEMLMTFAISLAAIYAAIADSAGLGMEVGGLAAGVSLASTPYRETISSRMAPLRDFLLLFFFVGLGTGMEFSVLGAHTGAALVFALFVLIGNPFIVLVIMMMMGFQKRTGFLAGLTVAQISEFSLIFIAMGISLGHIEVETLGLVTLVGLVTIATSAYMITFSQTLYRFSEPILALLPEARQHGPDAPADVTAHYDVVLIGLGRLGSSIAVRLSRAGRRVLGIDFNPNVVSNWQAPGVDVQYGDSADLEFLATLPLQQVKWAVSAVPRHPIGVSHEDPAKTFIQNIRAAGFQGKIAVTSHSRTDSEVLKEMGADIILEPFEDAAERAVEMLCGGKPTEIVHGPLPESVK